MTEVNENIVTLFKNSNGNCNVVLHGTNQLVSFIDGRFFTADRKLERLLQQHADDGEMGIFVDRAESTIDTEAATPLAQMEKKIRAQILAEMREAKLGESSSYAPDTAKAHAAIGGTDRVVGADSENPDLQKAKEESIPSAPIVVETTVPAQPPEGLSPLERLEWLKNNKPS